MEEKIEQVLKEMEGLRKRRDDLHNLPREAAHFLHVLVKAAGIKNALEVGTSNGYSGIWLVAALARTGGHLTTIDLLPEKTAMAKDNFQKAGLEDQVSFITGNAKQILPQLAGPFDFVFFDADKEPQLDYLKEIYPRIRPGGLIVCDNVQTHHQELAGYLRYVGRHPDLDSLTVPLGNGLEVSYKRR